MKIVSIIFNIVPDTIPPIIWRVKDLFPYLFGICRTQETYGLVFEKFITDHNDIFTLLMA